MKLLFNVLLLALTAVLATAAPLPHRRAFAAGQSLDTRDDVSAIPEPEQHWDGKEDDGTAADDDIWGEKDTWHNDTDLWGHEHFAPDSTN